jgi:hypothetical protein
MVAEQQDPFDNPTSKLRYEAFSRLQAAAVGGHRDELRKCRAYILVHC